MRHEISSASWTTTMHWSLHTLLLSEALSCSNWFKAYPGICKHHLPSNAVQRP